MGLIDINSEFGVISVNPNNANLSKYEGETTTYSVFLDGIGSVSITESEYNQLKNNSAE